MDPVLFDLLTEKTKDPQYGEFYQSLIEAIELKDTNCLLKNEFNIDVSDKIVYDFLVDFQNVVKNISELNIDARFDFNNPKEYMKQDSPLAMIAMGINLMLDELVNKTIPLYYFNEIFEIIDSPAILTDIYGNIKAKSKLHKMGLSLGLEIDDNDFSYQKINIDTIIPGATKKMKDSLNIFNKQEIKNVKITSDDGTTGLFNIVLKHLSDKGNNYTSEGFVFVFNRI